MISVQAETLHRQITSVLRSWEMPDANADTCADVMVDTDLHGIDSHGIGMLSAYLGWYQGGKIDPKAEFETVKDYPSMAVIDGRLGLGHPTSFHAMKTAMEKCANTGVGVVATRNSNHYGAAGYYARLAAENGYIGIAMTSTPGTAMVPTFGREGRLGTNPIAFAAPAKNNPPFLLDMATTTVAVGKVSIAKRLGKPMPEGWAIDREGNSTTDASVARELRLLTPLGGKRELGSHKGYGLGAMVEILCCTLSGATANCVADPKGEMKGPLNIGHFFMALDPGMFRDGDDFGEELDGLIDALHGTPASDEEQPVLVAGDPERAAYAERIKDGIPLSDALVDEVREVAAGSDVPFILLSNR